jgi:outer membrane protein TolC
VEVDDPMLVPVPPAQKVLPDWRTALDYVRTRSTNYREAELQVDAARGRSRMALATVLPTLTGNGQLQRHLIRGTGPNINDLGQSGGKIPNPATTWNLGASLNAPIFAPRNWFDYKTTRREIERAELQTENAERLIIGGLAEAIVTVVTTERLSEVTRVNLAAALSNLELNRRRARLGSGNAVDVLRSEQDVQDSRAQVVTADEALRRAREALGMALGFPEAWGVPPHIKLDELRKDARQTCSQDSQVQDRADIRAAAAGAAIAERNLESVSYGFLPTANLVSIFTYNSYRSFTNRKRSQWTIGGTLTWHLYDGGRRYGERTLNRSLFEQSEQQLVQAERNAQIEVVQAIRGVHVAEQSLQVAEESQRIALDNAKLARSKFVNGTGTSFDMVDTQRTARQTKIDVTVREFELLRAEIIAYLSLASCKI